MFDHLKAGGLGPNLGERELCGAAAANVASRIRHGTNLEWHQLGSAAVGTHQITKVAHWGTNMGISVADEIRNCTNLGSKARWIVGHEEPAKVPQHQVLAQDPE